MANERLNRIDVSSEGSLRKIAAVTDPGERKNLILSRRINSMIQDTTGWAMLEVQVHNAKAAAKDKGPVYMMPDPNIKVKLNWDAINAAVQKPLVLGTIPVPYA